jgi:hypothetical protein
LLEEFLKEIIQFIKSFLHRKQSPPKPAHIIQTDLHSIERNNQLMSTATLTWTLPTTRVDGSPLPTSDIAQINVFDQAMLIPGNIMIGSVPGPATTFTTGVLTVDTHGFTVVVQDTTGHMSVASNVATVVVPATQSNPNPATDLVAVLNS